MVYELFEYTQFLGIVTTSSLICKRNSQRVKISTILSLIFQAPADELMIPDSQNAGLSVERFV